MIAVIAGAAYRPEDRAALRRHAEMIARGAREGLPEDEDRRAVEERYQVASLATVFREAREPSKGGNSSDK